MLQCSYGKYIYLVHLSVGGAERGDGCNEDYNCDCVVKWQGGSLDWICAAGGRGGDKNNLE